ncbi:hypothetical protein [Arthrobacter sp. ISL-72]|uniref:hypothetical protein n=1 Tax=Arthrobacter sp. ISL-72 TaxID=2819114 RepID=UPI001BE94F59|nr:hypothetical protein [Arthrobacter sp. ISL-72]MBT2596963.1 hypothetical protein [Arthrobacter sp. ISL-72]
MADSSTDGSANTAVIPLLEGQTCIGELLPEIKDLLEPIPSEWGQPDADGSVGGQLTLF